MKASEECPTLSSEVLLDRLFAHRVLGAAPLPELRWLLAHGTYCQFAAGEVIALKGGELGDMQIIFSGRIALFLERGGGPVKLVEWTSGDVTGAMPYSRVTGTPGNAVAQEESEVFLVSREYFQAMTRECFNVTSMLVHTMLDRARTFTAGDLQDEKMLSLGKLSAGLAHELNNPASAIERSAASLSSQILSFDTAAFALFALGLSRQQMEALTAIHALCHAEQRTSIEQMDREETLWEWLSNHGLEAGDAAVLAETSVSLAVLEQLASVMDRDALGYALRSAMGGYAIRTLATGIQDGSRRISRLVNAVKGFTQMDRENIRATVDLEPALRNTIAVLCAKAQQRSAEITLELERELPLVHVYPSEINQVWGSLIDNALDAIPDGGRVKVSASREGARVIVRIADNGDGIPSAIQNKIFDPFFTTKPQGQGIGLGLDIARRLIRHNDGMIEFDSVPGSTEFRVILPAIES